MISHTLKNVDLFKEMICTHTSMLPGYSKYMEQKVTNTHLVF